MKYIKTFEDLNVNIGDLVICVDNSEYETSLTLNKIYIVELSDGYFIYVTNDRNVKQSNFKKYRFRLATPEEIDEYEAKIAAQKYNI